MAYRGRSESRLLLIDIGGHEIGIYHRSPTASEYQGYHTDKIKLEGRRVRQSLAEANLRYGLKIITGIRNGDLEYRDGANGDARWITLDTEVMPESVWKNILKRDFFELIDFVGAKIFNPVDEVNRDYVNDDEREDRANEFENEYTEKNS